MLTWLAGLLSNDLAIDLGTANTLVYARGRGIICSEPSVVAVTEVNRGVRKVLAVGSEAKEMVGRTPGSIRAIRPIKDGVIADFEVTEAMLRYFIQRAHTRRRLVRPRIIICVPPCITSVEKRAVRESAISAGATPCLMASAMPRSTSSRSLDSFGSSDWSDAGRLRADVSIRVATISGQRTETLTLEPRRASSWCRHSLSASTACLLM